MAGRELTPAEISRMQLPVDVKVTKGWLGRTVEDTIANEDLFTFFRNREETYFLARNHRKKFLQIPVDCLLKFQQVDADAHDASGWAAVLKRQPACFIRNPRFAAEFVNSLPVCVVMAHDLTSGPCDVADIVVLQSLERENTLIGHVISSAGHTQDIVSIPLTLDVAFVMCSVQSKQAAVASQYDILWPQEEEGTYMLPRKVGQGFDPTLQAHLREKVNSSHKALNPPKTATMNSMAPAVPNRSSVSQKPVLRAAGATSINMVRTVEEVVIDARHDSYAFPTSSAPAGRLQQDMGYIEPQITVGTQRNPSDAGYVAVVSGPPVAGQSQPGEAGYLQPKVSGMAGAHSPKPGEAGYLQPKSLSYQEWQLVHGPSRSNTVSGFQPPRLPSAGPPVLTASPTYATPNRGRDTLSGPVYDTASPSFQDYDSRRPTADAGGSMLLSAMTVADVTDCLAQLGLSQYQHAFEREQIDGLLFGQLDEQMLTEDLGVASKLHQKKILLHLQLRKEKELQSQ
eukprot:m.550003 g.550003  ORF g.550003 m.550003 type:complete len:512 (-) comp57729_c0_seq3:137-1672(-)